MRQINARANAAIQAKPSPIKSPQQQPQRQPPPKENMLDRIDALVHFAARSTQAIHGGEYTGAMAASSASRSSYFPPHTPTAHHLALLPPQASPSKYLSLPTPAADPGHQRKYFHAASQQRPAEEEEEANLPLHDISELTRSSLEYSRSSSNHPNPPHHHPDSRQPHLPHQQQQSQQQPLLTAADFDRSHRSAFLAGQARESGEMEVRTREREVRALAQRMERERKEQEAHQSQAHQQRVHQAAANYGLDYPGKPSLSSSSSSFSLPPHRPVAHPLEHSDDVSRALSASLASIQQLRQTLSTSRDRVREIQQPQAAPAEYLERSQGQLPRQQFHGQFQQPS